MEKIKRLAIRSAIAVLYLTISNQYKARSIPRDLLRVEHLIESLGTKVIWASRPFDLNGRHQCGGEYGYYSRSTDYIMICQNRHFSEGTNVDNQNELIATLKHEGWHAVQYKCNGDKPVLNSTQIKKGLSAKGIKGLHTYHPLNVYLEAEARVIERLPTDAYIRGVKTYCRI